MFDLPTTAILVGAAGIAVGFFLGRKSAPKPALPPEGFDPSDIVILASMYDELQDLIDGTFTLMDPVDDRFSAEIEDANPVHGVENPDYVLMGLAIDLVRARSVPDNLRNLELAFMVAWLLQLIPISERNRIFALEEDDVEA